MFQILFYQKRNSLFNGVDRAVCDDRVLLLNFLCVSRQPTVRCHKVCLVRFTVVWMQRVQLLGPTWFWRNNNCNCEIANKLLFFRSFYWRWSVFWLIIPRCIYSCFPHLYFVSSFVVVTVSFSYRTLKIHHTT